VKLAQRCASQLLLTQQCTMLSAAGHQAENRTSVVLQLLLHRSEGWVLRLIQTMQLVL
jgi:hypothetical protein